MTAVYERPTIRLERNGLSFDGTLLADDAGTTGAGLEAVEAAVLRGIERAVRSRGGQLPPGTAVTGRATAPTGPEGPGATGLGPATPGTPGGNSEARTYQVPSYQDRGRPVAVGIGAPASAGRGPSAASPAPKTHPLVTLVNTVAERVRTEHHGQLALVPPPATGLFGRMWHQGMAEDTRRLLGPTPEDLRDLENQLFELVGREGLRIAGRLLDQNEAVTRREAARYANAGADASGLRDAARELGGLQRQILTRLHDHGNEVMAAEGGPQAGLLVPWHFDDYMEGWLARDDPEIAARMLPRLRSLQRIYGARFPILLTRNADFLALADPDQAGLNLAVHGLTTPALESIATLRRRLGPDSVWSLPLVLAAVRRFLGILPGTEAAAALDRHLAEVQFMQGLEAGLLAALGITLAIAATVATAGAAAPGAAAGLSVLAEGLTLAAAGASAFGVVDQYLDYEFQHAASTSSLDPATALATHDPSIAWLAIAIIGSVLDIGAAAVAVRNLAGLAKAGLAARELSALEQAARAQARVLAAEGRLGGTEEEFVQAVLRPARQRLGGAASKLAYKGFDFAPNADGARSLDRAVAIARQRGVVIEPDVLIRIDPNVPSTEFARYGPKLERLETERIGWEAFLEKISPPKSGVTPTYWVEEPIEEATNMIRVGLRPEVLESDEAIVAVLAHEMHEVNALRQQLAMGRTMTVAELNRQVNGVSGPLHLEAWRVALDLVRRMRATP